MTWVTLKWLQLWPESVKSKVKDQVDDGEKKKS